VLEKWAGRLLSFAVFALLTRLLDPSMFGLFSMTSAAIAIATVFVDSGFSKALVQRRQLTATDISTVFWSSFAMSLLVYAVLFVTAPLLASAFGDERLVALLRVIGLAIPIAGLSRTAAALLERDLEFRALAVRQLAGAAVGAAVALPMAFAGAGVWALAAQAVATAATSTAVLWIRSPWRPSLAFSRRSLRSMLSFGIHALGIELLAAVQSNIDKFVVAAFFDARTLGYYFIAQRATGIVLELVTSVLGRVSLSALSKVQTSRDRLNRVLRQMTLASATVALPMFLILAVFAEDVLPVLVGDGWDESVTVFQILTVSSALAAVMFFDVNVLTAVGRPAVALRVSTVQNIVGIVLMIVAAPAGPLAVAASRSVRLVVMWPLRLRALSRSGGIELRPYLSQIARTAVGLVPSAMLATGLAATPWGASGSLLLATLPIALIAIGAYAVVTWFAVGHENRAFLRQFAASLAARRR